MAQSEPTAEQTLAVVMGASFFRHAPKLAQGRAFYTSANDFREYLASSDGLNLPRDNIIWLFDDSRSPGDQLQDIANFLEERTASLKDRETPPQDLIAYYVGHGLFSGPEQTYYLAIRATDERRESITSIRVGDLASIIKAHARFIRKFLILDCCFSSAAYKEFQTGPLQVGRIKLLDEFPQKGTTLLCSASAQDPSLAPTELSRTMFSDSLLRALDRGHPSLGPRLSLNELGDLVKSNLKEAYPDRWVRPEVHSPDQREGDVASVHLFPNAAFTAEKEDAQPKTETERTRANAGEAQAERKTAAEIWRREDPETAANARVRAQPEHESKREAGTELYQRADEDFAARKKKKGQTRLAHQLEIEEAETEHDSAKKVALAVGSFVRNTIYNSRYGLILILFFVVIAYLVGIFNRDTPTDKTTLPPPPAWPQSPVEGLWDIKMNCPEGANVDEVAANFSNGRYSHPFVTVQGVNGTSELAMGYQPNGSVHLTGYVAFGRAVYNVDATGTSTNDTYSGVGRFGSSPRCDFTARKRT